MYKTVFYKLSKFKIENQWVKIEFIDVHIEQDRCCDNMWSEMIC